MTSKDEEYLEATEIGIFLDDMMNQISLNKPGDKVEFAQRFFKNLKSGVHVLGAPYSYVMESNYNRRCLVYCLMEAFQGFQQITVSAIDFFHLVESVSPNFPRSVVMETVEALKDNKLTEDDSTACFEFQTIANAVYCHIVYDEWFKLMDEYFVTQKNNPYHHHSISATRVAAQIDEFASTVSLSVKQPSAEVIHNVLREMESAAPPIEMTAESFRKAVFTSPGIAFELRNLAYTIGS